MWYRRLTLMLGIWLLASPLVFRDSPHDPRWWWLVDAASGIVIVAFTAVSVRRQSRALCLVLGMIGIGLIAAAYLDFANPTTAAQNRACAGLAVLMLALAPLACEGASIGGQSRGSRQRAQRAVYCGLNGSGPAFVGFGTSQGSRTGLHVRDVRQHGHRQWDSRL